MDHRSRLTRNFVNLPPRFPEGIQTGCWRERERWRLSRPVADELYVGQCFYLGCLAWCIASTCSCAPMMNQRCTMLLGLPTRRCWPMTRHFAKIFCGLLMYSANPFVDNRIIEYCHGSWMEKIELFFLSFVYSLSRDFYFLLFLVLSAVSLFEWFVRLMTQR